MTPAKLVSKYKRIVDAWHHIDCCGSISYDPSKKMQRSDCCQKSKRSGHYSSFANKYDTQILETNDDSNKDKVSNII